MARLISNSLVRIGNNQHLSNKNAVGIGEAIRRHDFRARHQEAVRQHGEAVASAHCVTEGIDDGIRWSCGNG